MIIHSMKLGSKHLIYIDVATTHMDDIDEM